jgi:hypothetical protein
MGPSPCIRGVTFHPMWTPHIQGVQFDAVNALNGAISAH